MSKEVEIKDGPYYSDSRCLQCYYGELDAACICGQGFDPYCDPGGDCCCYDCCGCDVDD